MLNKLSIYDLTLIRERLIELCNMGGVWSCFDPKFLWPQCPRVATRSMRIGFKDRGFKVEHHNTVNLLRNTDPSDLADYFIWAFVRDPFDRVISIKNMTDNFNLPWDGWISGLTERVKFSLSQDNPDDNDYVAVQKWVDAKHHSPCSYSTHINGKQFVDFIGRYETLDEDWQRLLIKLRVDDKQPLVCIGKTCRKKTLEYYANPLAVEAVETAYADDLSILYSDRGK